MKLAELLNPKPVGKIASVLAYLDSLPDDEVVEARDLATGAGAALNYIRNTVSSHPKVALRTAVMQVGGVKKRLYGSIRAIKKLNDQLAKRA